MTTQLYMLCGFPYPIPTPNLITILNFVYHFLLKKVKENIFLNDILSDFPYFYILWKWHRTLWTLLLLTFFSVKPFIFKFFFLLLHIALVHLFTTLWITEVLKGNGFTRVISFILLITVAHSKKFIVTIYVCRHTHTNPFLSYTWNIGFRG